MRPSPRLTLSPRGPIASALRRHAKPSRAFPGDCISTARAPNPPPYQRPPRAALAPAQAGAAPAPAPAPARPSLTRSTAGDLVNGWEPSPTPEFVPWSPPVHRPLLLRETVVAPTSAQQKTGALAPAAAAALAPPSAPALKPDSDGFTTVAASHKRNKSRTAPAVVQKPAPPAALVESGRGKQPAASPELQQAPAPRPQKKEEKAQQQQKQQPQQQEPPKGDKKGTKLEGGAALKAEEPAPAPGNPKSDDKGSRKARKGLLQGRAAAGWGEGRQGGCTGGRCWLRRASGTRPGSPPHRNSISSSRPLSDPVVKRRGRGRASTPLRQRWSPRRRTGGGQPFRGYNIFLK